MKSLTVFSQKVLEDFGDQCGVSTTRDRETVARRVELEGDSFLTITLPSFGKDFLASLEAGRVEPNTFRAFKHGRAGLPRFLGGFLALVFDENGVLRDDPSSDAIRAVHGFTAMFAKIREACSDERTKRAMLGFVATDVEVGTFAAALPDSELRALRRTFDRVFGDVLHRVDREVDEGRIIPKHGPGNTAEKLSSNAKYDLSSWTDRLEFLFPAGENLFPNWSWYNQLQEVDYHSPGSEPPVRVVAVPKTAVTPRIIAIEPAHMQYVQQGILEALTSALQTSPVWELMGNLDQTPNQRLALESSRTRELATLDLSEASDRVSLRVVEKMLQSYPSLREGVLACRSQTADVLGYGVHPLSKFASMGSALCFPVESMVFTAIILHELAERTHTDPAQLVRTMKGRVRVYGDDIIVPVDDAIRVIARLESYGLKVNRRKTFWRSNFRESCGMDAWHGRRITPVRMRKRFPSSREDADEIVGTIEFRNQLFEAGAMDRAVGYLDALIRRLVPTIGVIPAGHPALGLWSHTGSPRLRTNQYLHRAELKAHVVVADPPSDPLDGRGALMKALLKRGDEPRSRDHLLRSGRPQVVRMRPAWLALEMRQAAVETVAAGKINTFLGA